MRKPTEHFALRSNSRAEGMDFHVFSGVGFDMAVAATAAPRRGHFWRTKLEGRKGRDRGTTRKMRRPGIVLCARAFMNPLNTYMNIDVRLRCEAMARLRGGNFSIARRRIT